MERVTTTPTLVADGTIAKNLKSDMDIAALDRLRRWHIPRSIERVREMHEVIGFARPLGSGWAMTADSYRQRDHNPPGQ